jgi:dolichyl-phosphate-mannose-protein mannosyltransferase
VNNDSISKTSSVSAVELIVVLMLAVSGLALRGWAISRVGLDHFDEGVYAISASGLLRSHGAFQLYPEQEKFSPPLFFSLVAMSYAVNGGPSDTAALAVNVLLGAATILLVWWIGRQWFGAATGVFAAALVAFSEFHIALSRSALTDVTFLFLFALAVFTATRALVTQRITAGILAGIVIGLAWNTKYHGWLVLPVVGTALAFSWWRSRQPHLFEKEPLKIWLIMGGTAALAYLPWALFVEAQPGGYAALAQHQKILLDPHWFANLWRQVESQVYLDGALNRCAPFIGLLGALLVDRQLAGHSWKRFSALVVILGVLVLTLGVFVTTALLALLALADLIRIDNPFPRIVVLVWFTAFLLLTPVYAPYPRLLLPLMLAAYLGGGQWLIRFIRRYGNSTAPVWPGLAVTIAAMAAVLAISSFLPDLSNPWAPSRSMVEAAEQMAKLIPQETEVLVIGEPSLAFYLDRAGRKAFCAIPDNEKRMQALAGSTNNVYVVTGIYSHRAPALREGIERLKRQLVPIARFRVEPKDIRLLDDFAPPQARSFRQSPDESFVLQLYRYSPK